MTIKSIKEVENEIIMEFEMFTDWVDKYNYIIELGKNLELLEEEKKTDNNLISGCQSRVWLDSYYKDGLVYYKADSDAIITKGLIGLLIRILSGRPPDEIVEWDLSFVDRLGLREHLSPTRSNGLMSMIKQMKYYAMGFNIKNNNK